MSEKVMDPELLKNISIVSSSHNHTDHLDGETLIPVLQNNPRITFIIPEANRSFIAGRVQCDEPFPTGLNEGKQFSREGFYILSECRLRTTPWIKMTKASACIWGMSSALANGASITAGTRFGTKDWKTSWNLTT